MTGVQTCALPILDVDAVRRDRAEHEVRDRLADLDAERKDHDDHEVRASRVAIEGDEAERVGDAAHEELHRQPVRLQQGGVEVHARDESHDIGSERRARPLGVRETERREDVADEERVDHGRPLRVTIRRDLLALLHIEHAEQREDRRDDPRWIERVEVYEHAASVAKKASVERTSIDGNVRHRQSGAVEFSVEGR